MPPVEPQGVPEGMSVGKFDGLKNTVDRERLGPRDLAQAVNVDLDDDGQLHRRRGRVQVATGDFHSLWNANDGTVYGVKDNDLGIVRPDYSFSTVYPNVGEATIAYCQINDEIFFSNAYCNGVITHSQGVVNDWGPAQDFWLSPVVNPTATLPAIAGRLMGAPPLATILGYYNGRIYLATGRMLWATDFQLYHLVNKTRGFIQFEDEITMVGVVADGVYVGTTQGLWFLGGGSFETLKRVRSMDSPVIPGSMVYIPAELANPHRPADATPVEVSVAFMTTRGFCVGQDGGQCLNMTEANFFFPEAVRASAFFRRQDGMNQYITSLDAEGSPVNGARFGDYVDAEIIRGNAQWVDMTEGFGTLEGYA
jgi:hypothetical protein